MKDIPAKGGDGLVKKAIVQDIIHSGKHGPFAVAAVEGVDGSVTFSLITDWHENRWPEKGSIIWVDDWQWKRAGWRVHRAWFCIPDEH